MAWRTQFKLGRPGAEALFEINPSALQWNMQPLADRARGGDGTLNKTTSSRDRPNVRLTGNYVTADLANKLRSIAMIDDTPLVFEVTDGAAGMYLGSWQERIIPTSTTAVVIPANSYTRGAALRAAAGGSALLTPTGIWRSYVADSQSGGGINYFSLATTFSEFFDSLVNGDLDGQGAGTPWVKISGLATWRIDVSATDPISGTKSARANFISGTSGAEPRYRRLTTFPADYSMAWKMRMHPITAFGTMELQAMNADSFLAANTSWRFRLASVGASPVFRWQIYNHTSSVVPVAEGAIASAPTSPYDFLVSRSGTTLTLSFAGQVVHSFTQSVAPDRLVMHATGATPAGLHGAWDDFLLSGGASGGSYNAATSTIVPGTALPDLSPVFVTYQATGIAADLVGVPMRADAGWVDFWRYPDVEIMGA